MMVFKGLQKVSLIDYPHKICAVVFTGSCNFRCCYCHNPELVLDYAKLPDIPDSRVIVYLETRKGLLDALCIGGGEPTLHKELPDFMAQVKRMDFLIKLDTNGTNPGMIKEVIEKKLVDYIAMDIKTTPAKYPNITGVETDVSKIYASIEIILHSGIDYELRTTAFPDSLTPDDAKEIAKLVKGAKFYILQRPRTDKTLDKSFKKVKLYSDSELITLAHFFPNCIIR